MISALYENVEKIVNLFHIKEQLYEPITQRTPYYHMGATITDAVLQAGLNYKNVVYPRVLKLLQNYSQFTSTCDFIILMQTIPLNELLQWKNERKLQCIFKISWCLQENDIQDETQLSQWLNIEENKLSLRKIHGVGPKTIDYLCMLCGNQSIAVDRHLYEFLRLCGIVISSYNEANLIYTEAAKVLRITQYELDRKIWLFMSNKKYNQVRMADG